MPFFGFGPRHNRLRCSDFLGLDDRLDSDTLTAVKKDIPEDSYTAGQTVRLHRSLTPINVSELWLAYSRPTGRSHTCKNILDIMYRRSLAWPSRTCHKWTQYNEGATWPSLHSIGCLAGTLPPTITRATWRYVLGRRGPARPCPTRLQEATAWGSL